MTCVATVASPMINTADPDIRLIKKKVADAIDRAEGTASPPGKAKKHRNATVTGGSLGSLGNGYAANQADDLDTAC